MRIVSPQLVALREELAEVFNGLLSSQDAQGWNSHVTVQNKVSPSQARDLLALLSGAFRPRRVEIVGHEPASRCFPTPRCMRLETCGPSPAEAVERLASGTGAPLKRTVSSRSRRRLPRRVEFSPFEIVKYHIGEP